MSTLTPPRHKPRPSLLDHIVEAAAESKAADPRRGMVDCAVGALEEHRLRLDAEVPVGERVNLHIRVACLAVEAIRRGRRPLPGLHVEGRGFLGEGA